MYDTLDSRCHFSCHFSSTAAGSIDIQAAGETRAGGKNRDRGVLALIILLFTLFSLSDPFSNSARSQDAEEIVKVGAPAANAGQPAYVGAIKLLPESTAGLIRIPNMPDFCDALDETYAGKLRDEELVKPFFDAQRERLRKNLESVNNKIGIKLDDLYEIASGEVVFSWVPFPNDKRRPYSLCVVADVRGRKDKTATALETIDQDLKAGGWSRSDITHQGEKVRIYGTKPKPGQLKVEQIAICANDVRVVAADRDSVITSFLDAAAGKPAGTSISEESEFQRVFAQVGEAIQGPMKAQGGTLATEWFARPFAMGRIIREALDVDRGNDIDIIKLLENQGFNAVTSAGGMFAINGQTYDFLHKGVIRATRPFEKAARMLQFDAGPREEIPAWVGPETASFNRLKLRIEDAFWASGSLIDEALGDEIFADMIEGIHLDKDGPQIDIKKNVLPNLENEIILVTDSVLPADVNSERMLVAIQLRDAGKIKAAVQKAMEVEPDATKMETPNLKGIDVWRVEPGQSGEDNFDEELFGDLDDFEEEEAQQESLPLLDQWAIAVVPQGPGSKVSYLMFSSHPELLIEAATRIQQGADDGLATVPEVKRVVVALNDLGIEKPIFDRVVRTKISLRVKYELLRQGRLRESDSVLAKMVQRIAEEEEEGAEEDALIAKTLPPIAEIEKYLADGGSYIEETADGWEMTGFLLK